MTALAVGTKAPDFVLKASSREMVGLSDLLQEGKYVILAFFPAAWSPTCGDEMTMLQEALDEFVRLGAKVVGISVDNAWSLHAWAQSKGISFPLLSDFHPKGEVAQKYGVLRDDGVAERALFIIDPEGVVRYRYVSPISENPGAGRLLDALERLSRAKAEEAGVSDDMAETHRLRVPVSESDWSRGPAGASVTVVEYLDYECPDCQRTYPIVESLLARHPEQMRLVVRHFPLLSKHPHAMAAALAAEAAGRQGKFWQMHSRLFENPGRLEPESLLAHARALGLDEQQFAADMHDPELERKIRGQKLAGVRSGVNGTPTLFINGVRYDGPIDEQSLSRALETATGEVSPAGTGEASAPSGYGTPSRLRGKRIAILVAEGFEDSELAGPLAKVKEEGASVTIVGDKANKTYKGKHAREMVTSDKSADQVSAKDFDAIIIPGGSAPEKLRLQPAMVRVVQEADAAGKVIAAICHGPQLLITAGLLRGRAATGWTGIRDDLVNAGADYQDAPVVIDGNLITSRMPKDIPEFVEAVVRALSE